MAEKMTDQQKPQIAPEKELVTSYGYRWFVFNKRDTGLRLVGLQNQDTGVIITSALSNPKERPAAHRAWAGARYSRSAGYSWEILNEMGQKGVDPDQKLDETFRTYGHKSVGDMARIMLYMEDIPMHACASEFNIGATNSGQERSSRYQKKFEEAVLHPAKNYIDVTLPSGEMDSIEKSYQSFGKDSLEMFSKFYDPIRSAFAEHFRPESKADESALTSRTLDCVRFFLLFGQNSSLAYETSARDWARIIAEMKASPLPLYRRIGDQIAMYLTPSKDIERKLKFKAEAPSLVRHIEPDTTTNDNLKSLKWYVEEKTDLTSEVVTKSSFRGRVDQNVELISEDYDATERMVAQYLLTLYPGMDRNKLLDWVKNQENGTKADIGKIIFNNHSHHKELSVLARTTEQSLVFEGALGELRDWNRHRAWGRFFPLGLVYGEPWDRKKAEQVLSSGFILPLYLTEVPQFKSIGKDMETDLMSYYEKLYCFVKETDQKYGDSIDFTFIVNLLPLAHQVDLWVHGTPKDADYMTKLRVRPGGHINYRVQSYDANQLFADSNPYLAGLSLRNRPDPSSREEFFNRS